MNRLSIVLSAVALTALAAPALAVEPELNAACTSVPAGAIVVTPGAGTSGVVETPVGAFNLGAADAGTYVVDLTGQPKGKKAPVTLTLTMDSPLPVVDYDLVVDGVNEFGTDNPEVVVTAVKGHCQRVVVGTEVFAGLPTDVLTLSAKLGSLR